jgi:single-strand DNA-binding protein
MQQRTEWHNVVCFARLGEIASEYLKKGSKVYIEGGLRTSSWEKDGNTRYRTEVIAREMQMLDSRGANPGGYDGEPPQGGSQDKRADPPQSSEPDLEDFDDDIPF